MSFGYLPPEESDWTSQLVCGCGCHQSQIADSLACGWLEKRHSYVGFRRAPFASDPLEALLSCNVCCGKHGLQPTE